MTAPRDFDAHHAYASGTLPDLDKLSTDTALLRRIAHNTNVIRLLLIWTLVIVPIIIVVLGIVTIVTLKPASPSLY